MMAQWNSGQDFYDVVGIKSVWDARTRWMRDTVRGLANVKTPEPAKRGSGSADLAIAKMESIPEFLRRT